MAQQTDDSKAAELGLGNGEEGLLSQDKELPVGLKKTPLRDLQSESNIVAQKSSGNPLVLKEAIITEASKVSGTKRPFPETPMSITHQQPPSNNGGNGHLVYVRRKSEVDAGKNSNSEVLADNANSPQPRQISHQEDEHHPKSLIKESRTQCLPAYVPIPTTSLASIVSTKPPASLGNSYSKTVSEEPRHELVPSAVTFSVHSRVNKNWEERYLQLQMFLKTLDQSSLDDHLQMLRSFSAVELSRHAVELEKRAIQISLEQAKELQRVKVLNVLGKSVRTSNGAAAEAPSAEQQQMT